MCEELPRVRAGCSLHVAKSAPVRGKTRTGALQTGAPRSEASLQSFHMIGEVLTSHKEGGMQSQSFHHVCLHRLLPAHGEDALVLRPRKRSEARLDRRKENGARFAWTPTRPQPQAGCMNCVRAHMVTAQAQTTERLSEHRQRSSSPASGQVTQCRTASPNARVTPPCV